jgi:hypothetical protein
MLPSMNRFHSPACHLKLLKKSPMSFSFETSNKAALSTWASSPAERLASITAQNAHFGRASSRAAPSFWGNSSDRQASIIAQNAIIAPVRKM